MDQRPAGGRVRRIAPSDFRQPVMKTDARMIVDTDARTEVHRHSLPKAHRSTDPVADFTKAFAPQAEMTTRLAAAERRALREEVERRPNPEPFGWSPPGLDFIDAEPEARPRQATDLRDRLLDQPRQFML